MNRIYKWMTEEGGDPRARVYASWFSRNFDVSDFTGIEALMYSYCKFCAGLRIVPTRKYLESYLRTDGKRDVKAYNIKTDTMDSFDYRETSQLEAAYEIISKVALTTYDSYQEEDLSGRDFKVDLNEYMNTIKSARIQQSMLDAFTRLNDGSDTNDVSHNLRNKLSELDQKYNTAKIKNVDLVPTADGKMRMRFLCKTKIPAIDGDIGGIFTRLIVTLTAQPGGGKSRMSLIHYCYQVLTEAKEDVLYYGTELSETQVNNILIAHHIVMMYGGEFKIPDELMNKDTLTEQQRQIYESARIDLFESGKYGKLIYKEKCILEELEDELIATYDSSGNLGLIEIDYMGLIRSKPAGKYGKRLERYEIITEAYEIVRDFLTSYDVSAVCINQYNDDGINAAYAGKPIRSGYVQGGHIVERHTDYDLHLTYTEEQKIKSVRTLSCAKSRGSKGFAHVLMSVDLSVSMFEQTV